MSNIRAIKCLQEAIKRIDKIKSVCANNGGVVAAIKDEDSAQLNNYDAFNNHKSAV